MTDTITLPRPDDWHVHLRDGDMLHFVAPFTARQFARAIVMPNLRDPVTTTARAAAYRDRIVAAAGPGFTPLMTAYLTDTSDAADLIAGHRDGVLTAVKLYPANATTNSAAGVTDIGRVMPVLEAMADAGMPLLIHGEVTDPDVDIFDREAVFIDRHLVPLRHEFPGLKIVLEHATTREGVQFVAEAGELTAATLTAHHLLYNRNALFTGGLRPHHYCLPVLKREKHRLALVGAATCGNRKFFLGTDSAPHATEMKEHASGCAGCYTALTALELYAEVFDQADALERLDGFASRHGPAFYGLRVNETHVTLRRASWEIPAILPFGETSTIKPLAGGQSLNWQVVQ